MTPSEKDRALLDHLRNDRLGSKRRGDDTVSVVPRDAESDPAPVREIGGRRKGLDPTRYGDWEKDGRCVDF